MLPTEYTVILYLILLVAGFIHGLLGFGYPFISTPLIAMFTNVRTAMLILLIPTMALNIVSIWRGSKFLPVIKQFWPLAVYFALGSIIGTQLLIVLDPEPFKLLLAFVLISYIYIQKKGVRLKWIKNHIYLSMFAFGLIGGILAGTVNGAIPALIIYVLELNVTTAISVKIFNMCFLSGKIAQTGTFANAGLFTKDIILFTLPLSIISLIGLWIGTILREKIDTTVYRIWLKRTLYILALLLVVQFVMGYL
ncbi:MAG: sulfite exporter TauE/SafE family protein [Desulfobacteraceae bacterium]|jgi:uncharacterized membrane protein YfcA|nr:sulfite exporter TauE/SafE family protein [Desulfobacteraceae bacterium]